MAEREPIDLSVLDEKVEDAVAKMYKTEHLKKNDIPQPVWKTLAQVCVDHTCVHFLKLGQPRGRTHWVWGTRFAFFLISVPPVAAT